MKPWKRPPAAALALFIAAISIYRMMMARALALSPDEAYYFAWSRRPDWCYYDQPAMVAWVDWLFALPFATPTAFTVRLGAVVLSALSTYLLYRAYREYRDNEGEAVLFAVAFSVLPFTWLAGFLMIHDTAMLPWLILSIWMIVRLARYDGRPRDWMVLALALTGAMYAKFSAFMLVWGIFLYMVWSPKGRRWWKTWPPYAAAAVSAVLYSPVLWWNHAHGYASLQAVRELTDGGPPALLERLSFMIEYVGSQIGIFSPVIGVIVFGALFKAAREAWKHPDRDEALVPVCLALPIFAYFLLQSTKSHVFGNWPGIGYIPLAMLGLREVMERARAGQGSRLFSPRLALAGMVLNLVLLATLSLHMQIDLFGPLLRQAEARYELKDRIDWRLDQDFRGWDTMVEVVQAGRDQADFILTRNYQTASMLEFYLPGQPRVESYNRGNRGNQWDLWSTLAERKGQTALFVSEKRMHKFVRERCEKVKPVMKNVIVGDPERPIKTWSSYLCIGWKGLDNIGDPPPKKRRMREE